MIDMCFRLKKVKRRDIGALRKRAENCNFLNKEETLILDLFITNLIDPDLQKRFFKKNR